MTSTQSAGWGADGGTNEACQLSNVMNCKVARCGVAQMSLAKQSSLVPIFAIRWLAVWIAARQVSSRTSSCEDYLTQ